MNEQLAYSRAIVADLAHLFPECPSSLFTCLETPRPGDVLTITMPDFVARKLIDEVEHLQARIGSDPDTFRRHAHQAATIAELEEANRQCHALHQARVNELNDARAEIERLRATNKRLNAMVVAGFAMYDDTEARAVVDAEAIAKPIMVLTSEVERLRAALEKHHWPDLVPGDGPCDVCGLSAEAWYRQRDSDKTTHV
jgi:hypothetical protein